MSTAGGLRLAKATMIVAGLAALHLADLIGVVGVALMSSALAGSWWMEGHRDRAAVSFESRTVALGVAGAAIGLAYLAGSALEAMLRVLLLILAYRLLNPRGRRAGRDVAFPCFAMLVAASTVSFGVALVLVFVVFLVAGTWMLMLQHAVLEMEGARPAAGAVRAGLGPGLVRLGVVASAGTLAITVVLFFVIPRIGHATLFRAAAGRMRVGFSDQVELGSVGRLETDPTVVMRVHLPAGLTAAGPAPLRWRGVVLDHFDGRTWHASARRRVPLQASGGAIEVARPRAPGPLLRQEISLEPIGSDIIFAAPRLIRGQFRSENVNLDDEAKTVTVMVPSARLRYEVESELEIPRPGAPRRVPADPLSPVALARYLQLPPLPPRIRELAGQVTAGSRDQLDAARRLTAFLSGPRFRYTLLLERQTALSPLDEFLFVRRSGNCEYFAAALAVMLRSLGIPARVVNGFQQGEWNPYGEYFMVRLLDAHAWVEAYVGPAGWVTLDPSPRGEAADERRPALGALALYLDALRSRFLPYVAGFSMHDQVSAVMSMDRIARGEQSLRLSRDWLPTVPGPLALALVAGGLLVAATAWRRTAERRPPVPAFYERAVRALARQGIRPQPGETAREFCGRVAGERPPAGAPFARLTAAYERVRFGGRALSAAEAREAEACAGELALSLKRPARRERAISG
jgi:hypothetical protein